VPITVRHCAFFLRFQSRQIVNTTTHNTASLLSVAACALLLAAPSIQAQEVYVKAGIPGVGAGYAHSFNEHFGVRADVTSAGTISRNGTAGKLRYEGDFKANQVGAYGDWFPFGGSFRLSAGLHVRTLEVNAQGRANQNRISIGNVDVPFDAADSAQARVKWPKTAPYLGIGWGHQVSHGKGFGFVADLGVSFGAPKTELTISDSLREKLDIVTGSAAASDVEIERQRHDLGKSIEKIKVFPHLFAGVSYRF